MKISKNKKLVFGIATGVAVVLAGVCGTQLSTSYFSSHAGDSHTESCQWNHYTGVAATVTTNGCKEFWACCTHPGEHVLSAEDVTGTNITEKGALTSEQIADLEAEDDRLITALCPGYEVVYDTTENAWVGLYSSADAGTASVGFTDETYGAYAKSSDFSRSGDQICFSPDVKENESLNANVAIYETLTFWVWCDQDVSGIGLKKDRYTNVVNYNLTANTWTRIDFTPDTLGITKLHDAESAFLGFGKWGSIENANFRFTSIYGKLRTTYTLIDAATEGMDAETYPSNGTRTYNNVDEETGIVYSEIAGMNHNEWMWVKPSSTESISNYDYIFFYVRSSRRLNGKGIVYDYAVKQTVTLPANTWVKVVVDVAALGFTKLSDIGFGAYGAYETTTLQFSSFWATAEPNHCANVLAHGCSETVALYTTSTYSDVTSIKFDAKLESTSTTSWCGVAVKDGTPDFYDLSYTMCTNPTVNTWHAFEYIFVDDGTGYCQVKIDGSMVTEGTLSTHSTGFDGTIFFLVAADERIVSLSVDNVVVSYGESQTFTEDFEDASNCLFTLGTGASIVSKF